VGSIGTPIEGVQMEGSSTENGRRGIAGDNGEIQIPRPQVDEGLLGNPAGRGQRTRSRQDGWCWRPATSDASTEDGTSYISGRPGPRIDHPRRLQRSTRRKSRGKECSYEQP